MSLENSDDELSQEYPNPDNHPNHGTQLQKYQRQKGKRRRKSKTEHVQTIEPSFISQRSMGWVWEERKKRNSSISKAKVRKIILNAL